MAPKGVKVAASSLTASGMGRAQTVGDTHHLCVRAVGNRALTGSDPVRASRVHHASHLAVTQGNRLVQFRADGTPRRDQPLGPHLFA